jgi:AcrR family transcriptional regulator
MASKIKGGEGLSTEEKFKEAARIVFTKKGYAATKTRDIAEQAGLNLALLNYYFRSKERLFEIVMIEKVQQLFAFMAPVLNNPDTSLHEKIDLIVPSYIDMLLKNPDLPLFVLSEIKSNPERFGKMIQANGNILQSSFMRQLAGKKKDVNPVQLVPEFFRDDGFSVYRSAGPADYSSHERGSLYSIAGAAKNADTSMDEK